MRASEVLRRRSRPEGFKEDHCWCKGGAEGRLQLFIRLRLERKRLIFFPFVFDSNKLKNLELVKKKKKKSVSGASWRGNADITEDSAN